MGVGVLVGESVKNITPCGYHHTIASLSVYFVLSQLLWEITFFFFFLYCKYDGNKVEMDSFNKKKSGNGYYNVIAVD